MKADDSRIRPDRAMANRGASNHLGIGLGYRTPLHRYIMSNLDELDFIEIVSDSFFHNPKLLALLNSLAPCVPHSVGLSLGSSIDPDYIDRLKQVLEVVHPPWHTDHLAFTRVQDVRIGHLAPIPYTDESLKVVVGNIRRVQEETKIPFGVENITMPFYWPNNEMEEHEFLNELVKQTGCYLLLDLENVRINHENHGRGAKDFIDCLPLEKIVQVHIAGGVHRDGLIHDTHSAPVCQETWGLLEYLCSIHTPPAVLLERDADFPSSFEDLVFELRRARSIVESSRS